MMNQDKRMQLRYVSHLKKSVVLPYKVNLLHYFAYMNNSKAINLSL